MAMPRSQKERAAWLEIIEVFLAERPEDKFCFQLMDIRHAPSKEDFAMFDILRGEGYPLKVIAAKADKISRGARAKHLQTLGEELGISRDEIIPFSAVTREGREEALALIKDFLAPE